MTGNSCKLLESICDHTNDVTSVDFHKHVLATGSNDKNIRLYRFNNDDLKFDQLNGSPLVGHCYGVTVVRFAPGGQFLASCSRDGKIIFWSMKDFSIFHVFCHDDQSWIRSISFSLSGNYLATAGESTEIKIWNYSSFASFKSLAAEASTTALVFSPDGEYLISGDLDGRLKSWSASTVHTRTICIIPEAHDLGVFDCDMRKIDSGRSESENILVTCGNDDMVKTWKFVDGEIELLSVLSGHINFVNECCFVSQTLVLSVGCDGKLHFWNRETGTSALLCPSRQKALLCCAVSGNIIATGSNDHTVAVYQLNLEDLNHTSDFLNFCEKDIHSWTNHDILLWCEELFPQYSSIFEENDFDGPKLVSLTHKDLFDIGIEEPEHQTQLLASISSLVSRQHYLFLEIESDSDGIPHEYLCPITREIMTDPVVASDGYTYERHAIMSWLQSGNNRSPRTNHVLENDNLIPNRNLHTLILNHNSNQ